MLFRSSLPRCRPADRDSDSSAKRGKRRPGCLPSGLFRRDPGILPTRTRRRRRARPARTPPRSLGCRGVSSRETRREGRGCAAGSRPAPALCLRARDGDAGASRDGTVTPPAAGALCDEGGADGGDRGRGRPAAEPLQARAAAREGRGGPVRGPARAAALRGDPAAVRPGDGRVRVTPGPRALGLPPSGSGHARDALPDIRRRRLGCPA